MAETFSVITINYNNLKGLQRTLQSVWSQSVRSSIQLVVVDGGSTDGSAEFLRDNEGNIDYLIIEKDNGIYDAMNKGISASTGAYLWFVNSGDCIYDSRTTENLLQLTQSNPGVVFGDTMFTDSDGAEIGLISKLKPQPLPQQLTPSSFRFGMCLCHQSFLVQSELAVDYDTSYRQAADIDWIIRILNKKPISVRYNGIISAFETGGSSYQNEKKAWKERFDVLKKHYGFIPNLLAHLWIAMRRILFKMKLWRP